MKHIALPDGRQRRLVFYLAMEEYIAKHLDELLPDCESGQREVFFLWQVPPTVIFGRNQVIEAEVNISYCKEHGINMFRRKSGGGCVYSDYGNIMLSCISDSTEVAFTFDRFLQRLALALCRLGLDAARSGRNDVLVGGRKVSGNAFFLQPKSSIVHGTLLFDTDFDALTKAITPSEAKIKSKGVESVRQHVTNIKDELVAVGRTELTEIGKFKDFIIKSFCEEGDSLVLDGDSIRRIEEIEMTYLDPEFIAGRRHGRAVIRKTVMPGVGEVSAEVELDGGSIVSCSVSGDFFPLKEGLSAVLSERLKGVENNRDKVAEALSGLRTGEYVMNLEPWMLVNLICNNR